MSLLWHHWMRSARRTLELGHQPTWGKYFMGTNVRCRIVLCMRATYHNCEVFTQGCYHMELYWCTDFELRLWVYSKKGTTVIIPILPQTDGDLCHSITMQLPQEMYERPLLRTRGTHDTLVPMVLLLVTWALTANITARVCMLRCFPGRLQWPYYLHTKHTVKTSTYLPVYSTTDTAVFIHSL